MAFRGDKEDIHSKKNPGNFLALLSTFAETDSVLHAHLHQPRGKNVTYLSPTSQNDMINVIGCDVIRAGIITEVRNGRFFSVLADEVSSHNIEHLALCLRFVDEKCDIREVFVAFVKLERVRASDITNAIVTTLEGLGLSLSGLRGQGYDGAATMSGEKSGVQKQIRDRQPKAVYTHCASHSLNLVVVSSCSVPPVRNAIDQIKSLTLWIKASPKREGLLKAVYKHGIQSGTTPTRAPLLNVCITRWVENIDGWERFSLSHPFLIEMCKVIVYGNSEFETYNDRWSPEDKRNALAHLKALESFEFIYVLITLQRSLLYLKEATVKLQGQNQDIVYGVTTIQRCCTELKTLRADIDLYSHRIFEHSCRVAECSGITVTMSRVSQRQQHRPNPQSNSVEDYFKYTVTIPFLDHLISDLSSRFDVHTKRAASLQGLLPTKITADFSVCDIQEAVTLYTDDLPNASIIDEEFHIWKSRWLSVPPKDRPQTLSESLRPHGPTTTNM